jgi:fructokinase
VVDTVCAGDAFSAGLLAGLAGRGIASRDELLGASSDDIEGALRFAAAVSAITVTRAGADPPYLHEVVRFSDVSPTGQAG